LTGIFAKGRRAKVRKTTGLFERLTLPVGATPVWGPLRTTRAAAEFDDVLAAICQVNDGLPQGWPIGLEQKLLARKLGALPLDVASIRSPLVANLRYLHIAEREHERRLGRPPSELAAQHLWEQRAAGPLTQADLLEAARLLGGEARLRIGGMETSRFESGHYLAFVAREQVEPRLDRLLRRINRGEPRLHPLLHAVGIYFEATLIHPLSDGNGRLARLLFQLALRQTIGLKAPILPLGPACAANRALLTAAYLAWEFDRNAQPLVDLVAGALRQLVELYGGAPGRG
jgi:Fic/DOC family